MDQPKRRPWARIKAKLRQPPETPQDQRIKWPQEEIGTMWLNETGKFYTITWKPDAVVDSQKYIYAAFPIDWAAVEEWKRKKAAEEASAAMSASGVDDNNDPIPF